jgi:sulfite reductase (NADPH) flavoprotein alpha-component
MTRYNFQNLYLSKIKERILHNQKGSIKETYQVILDTKGTDLEYNPGDCLGVMPENDPSLVELTIQKMHASFNEPIEHKAAPSSLPLQEILTKKLNITKPPTKLLKLLFEKTPNGAKKEKLHFLLKKENLDPYLQSHELWDLLEEFYTPNLSSQEICSNLLPILPRLYSISSSSSVNKEEIHLTVSFVEYETSGQKRHGVASNYLCKTGSRVGIYVHPSLKFFLPKNDETPIIMIGAGSGIAPFRSFMLERYHRKSRGKNWLFFGECNAAFDFYYEDFWKKLERENFLKITTAFSRDQQEKIYVQNRVLENSKELFAWLEDGASLYLCGDAKRMAKDVHLALLGIIQKEKNCTEEAARHFINSLVANKRYLKDVY